MWGNLQEVKLETIHKNRDNKTKQEVNKTQNRLNRLSQYLPLKGRLQKSLAGPGDAGENAL